jgi:hypothetical protein
VQELPPGWSLISLSVGSIHVKLACDDQYLADGLIDRYRDFPAETDSMFSGVIKLRSRQGTSAPPGPSMVFRDRVLYFTDQDFSGFIDDGDGHGQLEVQSSHPEDSVDYYLRAIYSLLAFRAGGVMFHAAGIVRKGRAFLFYGHSGSGKTTVSRLSPDDLVLNDDLVLLLPQGNGWQVHATPFWNPSQVHPTRQSAPLAGMYSLVQSKQVFLRKMSSAQALAELVSNVPIIPEDQARSIELLMRGEKLLESVPAYQLHFLPNDSFWSVIDH